MAQSSDAQIAHATPSRPPTVLIAIDGSTTALAAARRAVALFAPESRFLLAMVIAEREDPNADAGGFAGPLMSEEDAQVRWDRRRVTANEHLGVAATEIDVNVEPIVVPSGMEPGHALVRLATERSVDVIVIGASPKGLVKRLMTGSTTNLLVRNAPCPVLVVRDEDDTD